MQTNKRRRRRWSEPFIITPEIRASYHERCRRDVRENFPAHAREFPFTYAMALAGAAGMPLEWTRWINRNKSRPKYWLKARWDRLDRWWGEQRVKAYRIPRNAYEVGSEDELRQFIAHMRETTEQGEYYRTLRLGRYWFSVPLDHLVNREIVEPKTNPAYLAGAVGFRCDDYFFVYCVLPYRFREISRERIMAICFPNTPAETWEWNPDEQPGMWD